MNPTSRQLASAASLVLVFCFAPGTSAEVIRLGPQDNWFARLGGDSLQPGDEVVFRAGVYSDPRRLVLRHRGEPGNPIVIRAAEGERVLFRRPDAKQNSMNLEGCRHLVLSGLEITGGAAGIRIGPDASGTPSSDLVLQNLHIHHIGGVAVTCNHEGTVYRRITLRRNHIHHTAGHGEAFYLGANEGKGVFSDSLVEHNYIHDLDGPNVSQGDGIEIKQGSFGNRIVGNVIHGTKYPGITVYGTTGQPRNVIEDNVIWDTGDHGIQAAADAILRNNFIANVNGCGIYSRSHQGAIPDNLRIESNYVVATGNPPLRLIGGGSAGAGIEILGNTLMGPADGLAVRVERLTALTAKANRGQGAVDGSSAIAASWTPVSHAAPSLPRLEPNPAWKFLQRSECVQRFTVPVR
ncbi:right-handed parallel beta-helix repeat-containing protein [Stieleria sp. ICT_E10.1]|uniref:right-handed parallel beta-helix repeat-containing protein n=1 Tax=Stieleria sedimenti TaxID=2976331 RepID=UPI00218056E8|nr:right-handed parallel beta-helix repeat-containing protein [Stieleria sedimenti]MCS7470071.1 right-handed parallel beta-helix repeat-containing protein [Stieleria sedimenti]